MTDRRIALASRPRRRGIRVVEHLERRELLAWSALYQSLPDLTVSGIAGPVAAYGGPLTVNVTVNNLGANTYPSYDQSQTATSTADAPASEVTVYLGRNPHWPTRVIEIGKIQAPAVPQNSIVQIEQTLTLPQRTKRFLPPGGGTGYLFFGVELPEAYPLPDYDPTNNIQRQGVPIQIAPALPDLYAIALEVPESMQGGDTIAPTIKVANYGTANPSAQGSFDVLLVASTDGNYGPGDKILASFTVRSLPPLSGVPMSPPPVLGDVNIQDPSNVITLMPTSPITLPKRPGVYKLGVIVDPTNKIREINEIGRGPSPALSPVVGVGPRIHGLNPAGVVAKPVTPPNQFPTPPLGAIDPPVTVPLPPSSTVVGEPVNLGAYNPVQFPMQPSRIRPATYRNLDVVRKIPGARPLLVRESRLPVKQIEPETNTSSNSTT